MVTTKIGTQQLAERAYGYLGSTYLAVHNTIIGVALAVAGLAVASLLDVPKPYENYHVLLWLLLTASVLILIVTYAGVVVASPLLPRGLPRVIDLLIPILLSISEVVLFGILAGQLTGFSNPLHTVSNWFVAFAACALLISVSLVRIRREIRSEFYEPVLLELVTQYRSLLRSDSVASLVSALVALAVGISVRFVPAESRIVEYIGIGLIILGLCEGILSHSKTRNLIHNCIEIGR